MTLLARASEKKKNVKNLGCRLLFWKKLHVKKRPKVVVVVVANVVVAKGMEVAKERVVAEVAVVARKLAKKKTVVAKKARKKLAKVMVVAKVMVAIKAAAGIQIKPVAVRKEITKTKRKRCSL
jgi:ABC-type glucose/galactose transport system permease subunit